MGYAAYLSGRQDDVVLAPPDGLLVVAHQRLDSVEARSRYRCEWHCHGPRCGPADRRGRRKPGPGRAKGGQPRAPAKAIAAPGSASPRSEAQAVRIARAAVQPVALQWPDRDRPAQHGATRCQCAFAAGMRSSSQCWPPVRLRAPEADDNAGWPAARIVIGAWRRRC